MEFSTAVAECQEISKLIGNLHDSLFIQIKRIFMKRIIFFIK